jgi:dTDP-4-amino-4,6-dideoxygalactose transaminase
MNWRVPLFEPDFNQDDEKAALQPLQDAWLTMGSRTEAFEQAFAEKINSRYAFAVSNGTAALHLALLAGEIKPGDEVLLPSLTFVACANVVQAVGATPVFVDVCNEEDWTISPEDITAKITARTRAVIVVHYAGYPCRMDEIREISRKHHLMIIEDCAHALVTKYGEEYCGCMGDIGCFSLFSNKNMTTGEGGVVTTQNEALAEKLRLLRSHGMTTLTLDRHRGHAFSYDVIRVGLNYRLDEIRSSLGQSQLNRLDSWLDLRRTVYRRYMEQLSKVPFLTIPFQERDIDHTGIHIFPVLLKAANKRMAFMQYLKGQGIQTSIHYPPIHTFTAYSEFREGAACPVTENIAAREVTLPFYPGMGGEGGLGL